MYNKLVNINIINKILFLIVFVVTSIFAQNIYLLCFVIIILFLVSIFARVFKALDAVIIAIVLLFFRDNYLALEIMFRCLLALSVIWIFMGTLRRNEKSIILEKLFYKNPKKSKMLIRKHYNKLVLSLNKEKYAPLKQLLVPYNKYSSYISKEVELKTNNDINDIYLYSKLRFYNFGRKRKNNYKNGWVQFDNTVLLLNVMVIVLFIIWR